MQNKLRRIMKGLFFSIGITLTETVQSLMPVQKNCETISSMPVFCRKNKCAPLLLSQYQTTRTCHRKGWRI